VCFAFQLNHQAFGTTEEVHDKSVKNMLPTELQSQHATISEDGPRVTFGRRAVSPELACKREALSRGDRG